MTMLRETDFKWIEYLDRGSKEAWHVARCNGHKVVTRLVTRGLVEVVRKGTGTAYNDGDLYRLTDKGKQLAALIKD